MTSTERFELEIDLLEKKRQALISDLRYKHEQYDKSSPCEDGMQDNDVAVLWMSKIQRDRDQLDVEIAEKRIELYDLQAGPT